MEAIIDLEVLEQYLRGFLAWFQEEILVVSTLAQVIVIGLAFLIARVTAPRVKVWFENLTRYRRFETQIKRVATAAAHLTLPIIWLGLQWLSIIVASRAGWPHHLNTSVVSLLTAWIIIRLTSNLVRDPVWSKFVAVTAWTIAALNIVGLLGPTIALLDSLAVTLGEVRISALAVIKGVLSLAVLLWLATVVSRMFERRIGALPNLTPSIQTLFSKLLKIVLITTAVVVAVSSVGIDLTAFAVFSGAVGVGVGFGLQKVVSNLISGVILLIDKSIKPGDVISLGETYGWVNSLGARYASVVTRDGTEFLIPNEDLITQQVVNWSYSHNLIRLKIPIGISYEADLRKAIGVCLEAAAETDRVLDEPRSACLVKGFGDSSVDLELRIWIKDPQNGTANVRSAVLLLVWYKFHEHGIEIPFPQRDLHLRSPAEITIKQSRRGGA